MNHPRRFLVFLLALMLLGLSCGTAAAEEKPAEEKQGLIDKLMTILAGKNLPRVDIPAPPPLSPGAAGQKPPGMKKAASVEVAHNFLPVYALDRDSEPAPQVLPFFSSAPVNEAHAGIAQLVIMIHDSDREAARAFAFIRSAGDEASARHPEWAARDAFLFAPQFLNGPDIAARASEWPDGGQALLRWSEESWAYGAESAPAQMEGEGWAPRRGMSSFAVMDYVLLILARPQMLPDLKRVVIAGTGAGADFVQRYAALGVSPDVLSEEGIDIRFAVANAHSYVYLDRNRASANTMTPAKPGSEAPAFTEISNQICAVVNNWPFGLEELPLYGKKQGAPDIRLRYSARKVFYIAGDGATLPLFDTTPQACAYSMQGATTKARAVNFFASLDRLYGHELDASQRFTLIPKVNEDGLDLWRSPCGGSLLFSDGGECKPQQQEPGE